MYASITLKPPFRADDMAGLYKKVIRGVYPKIPYHFSQELQQLIKSLIVVQPQLRPSCDQILEFASIRRMGEKLFGNDFYSTSFDSS